MKVLLTSNASHDPPKGGSTRSNLAWLRHLASRGHECTVVAQGTADAVVFDAGIRIESYKDLSFRSRLLQARIREIAPDWVLVSSEDVSHMLLREADHAARERLVYLAHTPQFMPFGPESWHADAAAASIIRAAQGIVVIGRHMAGYVERHCGRAPTVIHPPIYGSAPWPDLGRFDSRYVLMVNPCTVKGLPVFLALARRLPALRFAALNGWGTTSADRSAIAAEPNVELLANVPDIEEVLAQTRVLIMPSLWYEGFGLITMEAMLRGIPVIASDSGGLAEAKSGTGYVIPVRPVERYEPVFDDTGMPRAVAPEQVIDPWVEALKTLTESETAWREESGRSRETAQSFVRRLDAADFESWLLSLQPAMVSLSDRVKSLGPAQKARLADLLKSRKKG
jgi:glycosyltransferase involved in cell wall biosynthesis